MTSEIGDEDILVREDLPVAHEADAFAPATTLQPSGSTHVTALHVVEKGSGVPDKTPVKQSEDFAAEAYDAVRSVSTTADDQTAYDRDIAPEIFEAADAVSTSAIALPREANV